MSSYTSNFGKIRQYANFRHNKGSSRDEHLDLGIELLEKCFLLNFSWRKSLKTVKISVLNG